MDEFALEIQPSVPVTSSVKSALLLSETVTGVRVAGDERRLDGDQLNPAYCPDTMAFRLTWEPGETSVSIGKSAITGDGFTCIIILEELTAAVGQALPDTVKRHSITSLSLMLLVEKEGLLVPVFVPLIVHW